MTDAHESTETGAVESDAESPTEDLGDQGAGDETRPKDSGAGELRVTTLVGVTVELPSAYPEVVLREVASPWRELRFPIAYPDGVALAQAWRRLPAARPMTHDVWADCLRKLDVAVEVVRIVSCHEGVLFAEVVLSGKSGETVVECRPSDALNLAVRQQISVPILVAEEVLDA